MICGREVNPDLVQVEKAKAILMEHEVAILEVLAKLADVSDGDDSPKQFQYHDSQKELQRIGRGMATQKDLYVWSGRSHLGSKLLPTLTQGIMMMGLRVCELLSAVLFCCFMLLGR
ncbi:uncharacterized protein LOC114323106 [Camellia sinensis]|uniref:uncharacterized protein LOC114323106 n=1 Tax=Camellia sinensis TaxID=4442 RepID=UPI001035AEDC|nr:uncharacterized protein LOC114323106 [Camellia sinensis]